MTKEKAIGYMILAARQIHLTAVQEEKLDRAMDAAMNKFTEEEAIEAYRIANGLADQERELQTAAKEWQWKAEREIEKEATKTA